MVRPSPTGDYKILCNHLHFAENGVREIMPADTKFVAIVRNPGTWLLKSTFKTEVCIEKGRSDLRCIQKSTTIVTLLSNVCV